MPGLFDPLTIRETTFRNRIMMSPMIQVSASREGLTTDWHLVHYGSRAVGGAGLVMFEATAVESRGRITEYDLGIWDDRQAEGLARIVAFCQAHGAKVGIQLAHAGRKAWSRNEGIGPEQAVGPSAVPFEPSWPAVRVLTVEEVEAVGEAFLAAARRAVAAGFDVIELHAAHGYLLHQFLSPLSNERDDLYGGNPVDNMRFPAALVRGVAGISGGRPVFVRVSASDYAEGGLDLSQTVTICKELKKAGADLIDVSSGGTTPKAPPSWRGYQIPFAETIRREASVATAAVGLVTRPELAEEIVRNGRSDLVVLGREFLRDPYWPLHAARELGVDIPWPVQYERAKRQ
ncbi:MAG: NADH:flavin oxidoreductase/NADH oxidase [Chloroflexota bacterium]